MSKILLTFDLDNTLVHSQIDFAAMRIAVADILREFGVTQKTDDELQVYSIGQLIALGAQHDAKIEQIAWKRIARFEREGMAKSTVESDAAPTLKVLSKRGFGLAVLTNNARPATMEALEKFELSPYFEHVFTRTEVSLKPDATGLLTAKSTFGAKHVFHIGDAWLDGAAAKGAGAAFVAFRPQLTSFEGRNIPIWKTVQQLSELGGIFTPSHFRGYIE